MSSNAAPLPPEETLMTTADVAALLHGEAIEQLTIAIGAIEAGDIETRCMAMNFAVEATTTLHLALDFDQGGEVIERMGAIYRVVLASLFRANLQNDAELTAKVIDVLKPLHDAWSAVSKVVGDETGLDDDAALIARLEHASRSAEAAAL